LARPISVSKLSSLGTWRNRQGCDRTSRFLLLNSPILWLIRPLKELRRGAQLPSREVANDDPSVHSAACGLPRGCVSSFNDAANIARIEPMSLRAGTGVVGAPKHPLPQNLVNAIASVVASCGDIIEAHLPQIFVDKRMTRPAQVLVLVVADPSIAKSVVPKVAPQVMVLFPAGSHLDIWPLASDNPLLVSIRRAECQICKQGLVDVEPAACTPAACAAKKKWWQV